MAPKVYIVVLNYNGWKDTVACVLSLLSLNYDNYRVIIVDNASTDESEKKLLNWVYTQKNNRIEYIQAGTNKGFAGGNNAGLKHALKDSSMKYAWILNNDTIVDFMALQEMVKVMESDCRIGVCGSKLMYEWDKSRVQGYGAKYNKYTGGNVAITNQKEINKIDYVIGASMLVSRSFLEEIGLLCEDYFLYFEELDWALRAKGKYRIACAAESVVYHKQGASIGGNDLCIDKRSKLSDYYSIRNRILFTKKYYPWCIPTVYLGLCWAIINRIRRKQWDRISMIFKLMMGIYDLKYESDVIKKCD